ncbi:hypothetical protein GGR54DRAFT_351762 [Hypoxylon sp. NC1633]|nr:hypothetical protein GGR54DRAFT_351762 [Hypoxylon sp. NC1633]
MAEPSAYRDHGLGDELRRHSKHKRTRGDEDENYAKRAKRSYDDDQDYDRRSTVRHHDAKSGRRSMSPRSVSHREGPRGSHHDDDFRRRDENLRGGGGGDGAARTTRRGEEHNLDPAYPKPHTEDQAHGRPPSSPSARQHQHDHPYHHHHYRRHRHRRSSIHSSRTTDELPFGARPLVRADLEAFKPLFAQYLEVQKCKDIAALDEREVRGRWKSFVGKWNHAELAEGWYSPDTLVEARNTYASATADEEPAASAVPPPPPPGQRGRQHLDEGDDGSARSDVEQDRAEDDDDNDNDDDEYGPTLPATGTTATTATARHGPGIPSLQDLNLRRESAEEQRQLDREQLQLARRADRAEQRARLEDLVPRAEAGTRERRLEKKKEVNEKMRAFRDKSPGGGGGGEAVAEAELLGGGDEVGEYKRVRAVAERRRSEREIRRDEEARARMAEREERVREYRRREEGTMDVLRRIARERFG